MFESEKCGCCFAYASMKTQAVMLHMSTKG